MGRLISGAKLFKPCRYKNDGGPVFFSELKLVKVLVYCNKCLYDFAVLNGVA